MHFPMRHLAVSLCPIFLLTACGLSGQQRTTQRLDQRLQTSLASDIAAGRAAVQPLPDGARVTLLDPGLFANSADALDNRQNDVRASVVEALLDLRLMRLQVADTSTLPDYQRDMRVKNVTQYFAENGLVFSLQPTEPLQAASPGSTPAGLTVTINVHCLDWHDGAGYGSGASKPTCD